MAKFRFFEIFLENPDGSLSPVRPIIVNGHFNLGDKIKVKITDATNIDLRATCLSWMYKSHQNFVCRVLYLLLSPELASQELQ